MSSSPRSEQVENPVDPYGPPERADLPDVDAHDAGGAGGAGDDRPVVPAGPSAEPALADPRTLGRRERIRPWSAWTLRAKLVASMLALFTVLSLATGAFTVVALDRQLTSQLDDQLRASVSQYVQGRPIRIPSSGSDDNGPRGPGDEGLVAVYPRGNANFGTASSDQQSTALTTAQLTQLSSAGLGPRPTTLSISGLGSYRVVATQGVTQDYDSGSSVAVTLVVGLPVDQQHRTVQRMVVIAIGTALAGIVLVALIGTWIVRRNLEPLRRVAGTATRVSQLPLDSGQVALAERVDPADTDTRTEVGQVGAAFNEMLVHVDSALNSRHQSEQRVRQFVADASHELRTPLASIKGYAELSRREPEPVPGSVTHAMGRIESEANRMSSLVEDLLLLARLDAGRPLDHTTVDLSMLVINAVSDAHAAAPDHRWGLDLPPEPVEVQGDPARLHQIVANLLGNARTHTPRYTVVTTAVRTEDDWVRISVHDNGPGVPESLQQNVFERFARGDDARNRAGGSTGLGLSIVTAVAKAHGGRVELDSRPGDTTFSVLLPLTTAPQH